MAFNAFYHYFINYSHGGGKKKLNGSVYSSGLMFHLDSSRWEILVAVFSKDERSSHINSFIGSFSETL